ncbi:MAG TPA: nucleoside-diphosphate sugar epimerase/dehydratase [Bryobacteraceae bacterium]|nr:nucleoside-diphosphate sugar epimerase/dehydratase [Bryobacteraceae bacterium]
MPTTWLHSLARSEHWGGLHRSLIWLAQILVFSLCTIAAFLLRFDFTIPGSQRTYLYCGLMVWVPLKLIIFRLLNLDRGWWRYVSIDDIVRLIAANSLASLLGGILILSLGPPGFPRSLYILDLLLCLLATTGQRAFVRILRDLLGRGADCAPGTRIFIYGAGRAGVTLLREIRSSPRLRYAVCGFIDDNPHKRGVTIQGIKVLGRGIDLPNLVPRHRISEILIAIPSAAGAEMVAILARCHSAGIKCRTIPALAEIIESTGLATQIRDVAVEDLLGRTPVRLEEHQIHNTLEGKVVLVTGAGGSIGSELCRQIARFHPAGIVGFEIAESPLFEIDHEMRQAFPETPFYPEIGSIQNRARLDEVLRQYSPSVVYHAAAYKHVPLMETHIFEAIQNNVFGTFNAALAAAECGVDDFVMISSDKAVRPTSVMGATKRLAELLLLALQNGRTKYVAVRFGNVLGSNGSVVPVFKKQIAAGGPVTVTHPDMRRFFMTIPEACQLVLQASAIGQGGQICVLDMSEPVKIVDLARNLILLSGLKPGEDIKIEFTGMRPGEKLCEELSTMLEDTVPSTHEKIRIYVGNGVPAGDMVTWLECLREICEARDAGRLAVALKEIVTDYSPSAHFLKRIIDARDQHAVAMGAPSF